MWRVISTGSPEVVRVSDSSPDLAETSFRELDDVFLQTKTRIWLGEVLHVRFDENVGIADLLADGELLFQVSKEVWKMLLRNHGELKHSKVHIYERTSSGKCDGRYMPYPKVDSFLKICQILGLIGIDLFSPSDVVEKRDIRRVCMCVRSFSKKARSKKLNVPDFDIVTYTIAMPTHLVGGIRRNLELSWCSPSGLSSPWNDAREICGLHIQHSDSRSDESVSNFSDHEFESPFSSASCDAANITVIVGETSPELSPIVDDFVAKTSFNNSIEDCNHHYEAVHENQDEMFAKSVCSRHLSTTETNTLQNLSSYNSEHQTCQCTSICFSDITQGNTYSSLDVKNGLKADDLAGTSDVETSCKACMNESFVSVAPSEVNQHSQSFSLSTFSHIEIHSNVEVEPCNTCIVFDNAITNNNKAMGNRFYYMETSDDSNSVTPVTYSLDTEEDGNDGNLSNKIKSPSMLDLKSHDSHACDSELEGSGSTILCRNAFSFVSSITDMQNNYSGSLVDDSSERNENELVHTSSGSLENDCALQSLSDDPNYLVKRKCGDQSTNPSISFFTENEFQCSSSSCMCLICNVQSIEDGSHLVSDNCMQENDVYKANFLTVLSETSISNLVPVVQEDVDIDRLPSEEENFCDNASYISFEGQFMSSCLISGTEVGSIIEKAEQLDTYHSFLKQENPQVVVKGNLSKEPCLHYNFRTPDSVSENKTSKCAIELIKNRDSSLIFTQGKDYGCIFCSMLYGSTISHLPCMDSTLSEQQKISEKEDSVEHTDGPFSGAISPVDYSDCSDELKMHQSFHDAADIASPLSDYESKIPSSKDCAMNVADEESSLNRWSCQYDDGKMGDFRHQMTKTMNAFYAKDLDVLDVMESSDFASGACASEMLPSFDFSRSDLFPSHRNILETEGETFQIVDILPSSTSATREGEEVASNESIEVEKHVVSYIHNACAEPNNMSQDILDTIMPDKCGKNKGRESRAVGKTGNQVLKSVAGVMTMVGAFFLFLHVRLKKGEEKSNEMKMSFQIQKPNKEFFTTRKIIIGKSDSLYPAEKLKF